MPSRSVSRRAWSDHHLATRCYLTGMDAAGPDPRRNRSADHGRSSGPRQPGSPLGLGSFCAPRAPNSDPPLFCSSECPLSPRWDTSLEPRRPSCRARLPGWSAPISSWVLVSWCVASSASGSPTMRWLFAAVGLTWLLDHRYRSPSGSTRGVGRGPDRLPLRTCLRSAPVGSPARWQCRCGLGFATQPATALLFLAIAAVGLRQPATPRCRTWYSGRLGLGLAIFLAGSWLFSRLDPTSFDPDAAHLVYEVVLFTIAIGFPLRQGSWSRSGEARRGGAE